MLKTAEVVFDATTREWLIAEARAAQPFECCGALLGECAFGSSWRVVSVFPLVNEAFDMRHEYLISAEQVRVAERTAEARGLRVVGFYHSHPAGDFEPSATDLARAWPGFLYVIAGAASGTLGFWTLSPDGSVFRPVSAEP